MSFEKIDPAEREGIESGSDTILSTQYGHIALLLMQGEMVWTDELRAAMCLAQTLRYRGWKLRYKEAYRGAVRGRYFWAERKEPAA